jgi:hypothetical protein
MILIAKCFVKYRRRPLDVCIINIYIWIQASTHHLGSTIPLYFINQQQVQDELDKHDRIKDL